MTDTDILRGLLKVIVIIIAVCFMLKLEMVGDAKKPAHTNRALPAGVMAPQSQNGKWSNSTSEQCRSYSKFEQFFDR